MMKQSEILNLVDEMNKDAGRVKCPACSTANFDIWHKPQECPKNAPELTAEEFAVLEWMGRQPNQYAEFQTVYEADIAGVNQRQKRVALKTLTEKQCVDKERGDSGDGYIPSTYWLLGTGIAAMARFRNEQP